MPRHARLLLGLLLALLPARAAAQTVRGLLVEQGSGTPIEGAMVWLVDARGRHGGVLTDAAGRFLLRAPNPGPYFLRTERIGYEDVNSDTIAFVGDEFVDIRIESAQRPVSLEGIVVGADQRCEVRPRQGAPAAQLWAEARKALEAAAYTGRQGLFRYELARWDRTLDPTTRAELTHRRRERSVIATNPMRSVPVALLDRKGYIHDLPGGGWDYFAPDANVLLSDLFLDTHCFSAVRGSGEYADLVGLAFAPVRGRTLPDIEGVLWMDRATAELRFLEFHYTRLPYGVTLSDAGGRVDLERVPGGAWIVRRWYMRMPGLGVRSGARGDSAPEIVGIHETGGEVIAIIDEAKRSGRGAPVVIASAQSRGAAVR
jgi:hypothetical protein